MWGVGGMFGKAVIGNILGRRSARRQNQQWTNWYNQAIQPTKAEKKYEAKLKREKEFGDPDLHQKRQELYRPVLALGKEAKADATGVAVRQGLENSIIASEMKSKIDAKTFAMIDEQADKILEHNKLWKKRAEDDLMNFELQRDARLRNLAMQYQQGITSSPSMGSSLLSAGGDMLGKWASSNVDWLGSEEEDTSVGSF